ncbi:response regulator [Vibrio sp. 404]|uniref:Response regulator n=1 Tax=Vibrio marinisediminis TaxID=2758441 RepID=A0A7W2ISR1_9VIBR|nr:response regulator [Vibrio marinisediminis]MBA5761650.1 response regulator [Vibrio marinisediminis]
MENFKRVNYDSPYKGMSVLIVDDFEAITRTLCSAFEQLGFQTIYQAKDGNEAVQCLGRKAVDIIISDWKMPKMDGLALLKHVRESKSHKNVPFIMLTGNLQQSDVVEAIEAGVSEYLVKPFSRVTLGERVHKAFFSPIRANGIQRNQDKSEQVDKDRPRTILVVDDEPSNLQVLGELLKPTYKIRVCRSGQQALDICAKTDKPDLILLDIMMPEMDGLDVCRALKSDPDTEFIPIIFVSALSQTDDVVKGLKLGAVDYIQKPVIPEIVLARVETHINSVIQREKLTEQIDHLCQSSRHRDEAEHTFFHDFRNPLTALHTTLVDLVNDSPQLKVLEDSAATLTDMIDNYAVLIALDKGNYSRTLGPVVLDDTLKQVIVSFQAKAKQKSIEFKTDVDPTHTFLGDELLSYRMFCNLLSNALEAAPDKSSISITSYQEEAQLIVTLHNQGQVPIELREHFFDKFVSSSKESGRGVGTYSAKLCVEAQQGTIQLDATDSGTTLRLTMKSADSA